MNKYAILRRLRESHIEFNPWRTIDVDCDDAASAKTEIDILNGAKDRWEYIAVLVPQ